MSELTPSQKRKRAHLALRATYKIEVVVEMSKQNLPADMNFLGLALARRFQELNSVIMSALWSEDNRETDEMRKVVVL